MMWVDVVWPHTLLQHSHRYQPQWWARWDTGVTQGTVLVRGRRELPGQALVALMLGASPSHALTATSTVPHFVGLGSQPANLWRQHANKPPWAVAQEKGHLSTAATRSTPSPAWGITVCALVVVGSMSKAPSCWCGTSGGGGGGGSGGGHIPALRCRRGAD